MGSLAALGLVCNILQVAEMSFKLVVTGMEIAKSTQGASQQNAAVEDSATQLQSLLENLTIDSVPNGGRISRQIDAILPEQARLYRTSATVHINAINDVALNCKVLGTEIIRIVGGLKVTRDTPLRLLRVAKATLKSVFKTGKELKELEDRLKEQLSRLSFCFLPLLAEQNRYSIAIAEHLAAEGKELAGEQTASIRMISAKLDSLAGRIDNVRTHFTSTASGLSDRIDDIKKVIVDLSKSDGDLVLLKKQQSFVRSLHFDGQEARHDSIEDHHMTTFEWIFSDQENPDSSTVPPPEARPADATKTPGFLRWLKTGTGIFWIQGKPGCGKSTLMKFIADSEETEDALKTWANGKELVVAAHYFWISGTVLQRSLKGLLLQLLFDVLRRYPALSQDIFPERFQHWDSGFSTEVLASRAEDAWKIKELEEALDRLVKHPNLPVRVCFFIDGLDEYDGDHMNLCLRLKSYKTCGSVKFCVSSRSWNVFQTAFGDDVAATLHVHDFTYDDIRQFAKDRLSETRELGYLYIGQSDIDRMSQYITNTAQGVFLWVVLATKSLRDGLVDDDTVGDLWRRLESFPQELNPFFGRILEGVGHTHYRYMAECFQLLLNIETFRSPNLFLAHAVGVHDPDYALQPTEERIRSELDVPLERIQRRFNACFGGLLSVTERFNRTNVDFIHRTVRDFLLTPSMQDYLKKRASPDFHVHLSALKAAFYCLRGAMLGLFEPPMSAREIASLAEDAMEEASDETVKLLDICTEIISEPAFRDSSDALRFMHDYIKKGYGLALPDPGSTTAEITKSVILRKLSMRRCFSDPCSLCRYRAAKLAGNENFFSGYENSLLSATLFGNSTEGIKDLLAKGADPHERLFVYDLQSSPTPWHVVLMMLPRTIDDQVSSIDLFIDIIKTAILLEYGASRTCDLGNGVLPLRHFFFGACFRLVAISRRLHEDRVRVHEETQDSDTDEETQDSDTDEETQESDTDEETQDPDTDEERQNSDSDEERLDSDSTLHTWPPPATPNFTLGADKPELKLALDVFLATSPEENQVQLADAMFYADPSQCSDGALSLYLRDTSVFEYVLSKAMDLDLPLTLFDPVLKNSGLRASMSEKSNTRLDKYVTDRGGGGPMSLEDDP